MKAVLVGGTGLVGARLARELVRRGVDVAVVSRATGIDALSGQGLDEAFRGADVVVDTLNTTTRDPGAATAFFRTTATNVAAAERAAGVPRHLLLSIVGLERAQANGYYVGKLAQEQVVRTAGVPFAILRATQFFEFLATMADWGTVEGKVVLPPTLVQPVAVDDVVAVIADLVTVGDGAQLIELAGPDRLPVTDAIARVLAARGDPRTVVPAPQGQAFGASSLDALVPHGQYRTGSTSLAEWVATRSVA